MKTQSRLLGKAKSVAGFFYGVQCNILNVEKRDIGGWHLTVQFDGGPIEERCLGVNGKDAWYYLNNQFRDELSERDPKDNYSWDATAKLFQPGGMYYDPNDPIDPPALPEPETIKQNLENPESNSLHLSASQILGQFKAEFAIRDPWSQSGHTMMLDRAMVELIHEWTGEFLKAVLS